MIQSILISIILSFFDFADANFKMQVALVLSELFNEKLWVRIRSTFSFFKKRQISVANATKSGDFNPIYGRLQSYLAVKYAKHIESCELIPKNGDIEFDIKEMTGSKFTDTYTVGSITHSIELQITEAADSNLSSGPTRREIIIRSNTATSEDIKNYVRKVSAVRLNNTNMIRIFRPQLTGKKKDEQCVRWDQVTVKTNKTLENTVYSKEIVKDLFDDIDNFMLSESWYAQRGIPYKRGYFLHSTPGQGKTSVAKILANKYSIPIFCLDLTVIRDNSTLTELMTELSYNTGGEKYILLLEDVERTEFFIADAYRRPTLSMDCFLNAIDGVAEPHGRIIIMTANEPENIIRHKALMRPGRIDKVIEIKACTAEQFKRLYELFYTESLHLVDWDRWTFNENLSAAYVTKLLQENIGTPEIFLRLIGIKNTSDKSDDLDPALMETLASKQEEQNTELTAVVRSGRSRSRRGRSRRTSSTIEARVKNTKKAIKLSEMHAKKHNTRVEKAKEKLPVLLEKLEKKKDTATRKKMIEKAKRKTTYMKKLTDENKPADENKPESTTSLIVDEEEYETPAFLANSIPVADVPNDTVFTYETDE